MNAEPKLSTEELPNDALPATGAPLMELRGICRSFSRGNLVIDVLHDISLDIMSGEFVAIMGASGSGKSTLMNIMGCLDRPTAGSYRIAGREVGALDQDERAQLRCSLFGFIFQQYHLIATANAVENTEIPAIYAGVPKAQRVVRARELLSSLGLSDRLDHRPNQLSGGQQQRVSIARALMNGGQIILADEPSGALDSRSGEDVMRLLGQLNRRGHTVLLITHDMAVAKRAHRIIEIRDGHIVSDRPNVPEHADAEAQGLDAALALPVAGFQWKNAIKSFFSFFDVAEAAKMALRSLKVNIFRTILTLLGIIIGVASVITMLAIGDGAKQSVMNTITAMGTNLLLIRPGAPNMRMQGQVTATLVPADTDAIAQLPNVAGAVSEFPSTVTIRFGNSDYVTSANSTTANFQQVRDWPTQQGTFFSDADLQSYAPVVVLGQTVARNMMLRPQDAIGKYVLLNNVPFQVIGVMAPKGATPFGTDMDDVVFVPLTTGRLRLYGQQYVRTITVQVEDVGRIYATQSEIQRLLMARHKVEDFQIRNMEAILQSATDTQATLTILLGSVAAISLLVGGIGVMNIMLVSVTERTREIGVRMATGARPVNILLQFNTEALAVCVLGGLIGVALGLGGAMVFSSFGRPIVLSAFPVLLAFGCAVATGVLFGYLPARKASRLDPVAALAAE